MLAFPFSFGRGWGRRAGFVAIVAFCAACLLTGSISASAAVTIAKNRSARSTSTLHWATSRDKRGAHAVTAGAISDSLWNRSASSRLYQCGTNNLTFAAKPGTSISTKAILGSYTAAFGGTRSSTGPPDVFTNLSFTVSHSGHTLFTRSFNGDKELAAVVGPEKVCIARFAGSTKPTVLLVLYTGGAHCCTLMRGFLLAQGNTSGVYAEVDLGNPGATLAVESGHVVILTALNSFAYAFADYADSALPIEAVEFLGGRFVVTTRHYGFLVAKDAASWLRLFKSRRSNNLGFLAAWVADEDLLGKGSSAWKYVDKLKREEKLVAYNIAPYTDWPSGTAFTRKLSDLLVRLGYQSSTTAQPPLSSRAALPRVLICSGTPTYKPHSLHWCTSFCSSYVDNLTWTSWSAKSATGTGTLMTNDGIPNCGQGIWTAHPGYKVRLSKPRKVSYCTTTGESSGLLFTAENIWGYPIPAFKPPCS